VSLIEQHRRGELAQRDEAFAKLLRLFDATQRAGGMSATKGALRVLGLPGGLPRRPRLPVSDSVAKQLATVFEELGLREIEEL
jgi:4-hydroxy-tetrahydrodipicolinate synthase